MKLGNLSSGAVERSDVYIGGERRSYDVNNLMLGVHGNVKELLGGVMVAGIWHDSNWADKGLLFDSNTTWRVHDSKRHKIRPSYALDEKHGKGGDLPFPMAMSWLSTDNNQILFPRGVDESFVRKMNSLGVLKNFVSGDLDQLPKIYDAYGLPIYATDDFPREWDGMMLNGSEAMREGNSKRVRELSSFAADYEEMSLKNTRTDELVEKISSGLFYLKLNNTENSGEGVKKCFRKVDGVNKPLPSMELRTLVETLKFDARCYGLSDVIALQPHVDGVDRNFQMFISPKDENIHLVTLSEQFVDENGSYQSSINSPFELSDMNPELANLIVDMANKYRERFNAYGFIMCDYIETEDGDLKVIDPGLRPTANTATAMTRLWVKAETGIDTYTSLHFVKVAKGVEFSTYSREIEDLINADSVVRRGYGVLPWGYNHHQGAGLFTVVSSRRDDIDEIKAEVTRKIKG